MSIPRVLLIVNPRAGGGRAVQVAQRAEALAGQAKVELSVERTRGPADATRIAREAAGRFDSIAAVGGDGTMHEVANGLAAAAAEARDPGAIAAMGVLPAGTGNDFIKTFGLPRDPEAAAATVFHGNRRRIDLGRAGPLVVPGTDGAQVEEEWFANDFSAGFGALVAQDMTEPPRLLKALPGRVAYFLAALRRGLARAQPMGLRIDGTERRGDYYEVHVGNGRFCGGGAQFTPHAQPDDALLDYALMHGVSRWRNFLTMLIHLQRGSLATGRGVDLGRCQTLEIEQDRAFPIYLDGEYRQVTAVQGRAAIRVEVVPAALDVLCAG